MRKNIERSIYICSVVIGAIYVAISSYLTEYNIQLKGSEILPTDNGYEMVWIGLSPDSTGALVCLISAILMLGAIVWNFLRPNLFLQIASLVCAVASAMIFISINLNNEIMFAFGFVDSLDGVVIFKAVVAFFALLAQVFVLLPSIHRIIKNRE